MRGTPLREPEPGWAGRAERGQGTGAGRGVRRPCCASRKPPWVPAPAAWGRVPGSASGSLVGISFMQTPFPPQTGRVPGSWWDPAARIVTRPLTAPRRTLQRAQNQEGLAAAVRVGAPPGNLGPGSLACSLGVPLTGCL